MQIYLVGGAVRDELLGIPSQDRDWVVVGSTAAALKRQGYQQVGKAFPIFLDPNQREEYALATNAEQRWDANITLTEDLQRRDLTLNAIAKTAQGEYVDPFNGRQDIADKILRHVDDQSFQRDPIRILRVARLAARYHHLGFRVAADTTQLMQHMVNNGQLDHWVAERVWAEIEKALHTPHPDQFFLALRQSHALKKIIPCLDRLFGVPQSPRSHPEVDTGIHSMLVLQQACRLSNHGPVRWAALLHDVGKGATDQSLWPKHVGHEHSGETLVEALDQHLKTPKDYQQLSRMAARYHTEVHRLSELSADTIITLLEQLDAFRRPKRFEQFLTVCLADCRGRSSYENAPYPQKKTLMHWFQALQQIDLKPTVQCCTDPSDIRAAVHQVRKQHLQRIM